MLLRKHEGNKKLILAICDDDIIGKVFRSEGRVLDLSSDFYKGEPTTEEELGALLKKAHLANAAGKDSTMLLVRMGLIEESDVSIIAGIPSAQVILRW